MPLLTGDLPGSSSAEVAPMPVARIGTASHSGKCLTASSSLLGEERHFWLAVPTWEVQHHRLHMRPTGGGAKEPTRVLDNLGPKLGLARREP
jgi:hypothetical protein